MAKKVKQDVMVPHDFLPIFEKLVKKGRAQAAAELAIAIIRYDKDGTVPNFTAEDVLFVWETVIQPKLDEYKKAYEDACIAKREAGRAGGNKKAENSKANQNVADVADGSSANQNVADVANVANLPHNHNHNDNHNDNLRALGLPRAKQTPDPGVVNEAAVFFSDHIRLIVPDELSKMEALVSQYGIDAFKAGVKIMADRGGRSMNYLEKILKDPRPTGSPRAPDDELSEEVISRVLA